MDFLPYHLSIVKGQTESPLWRKSLGSFVDDVSRIYSDRPAVISTWQSVRLSYRQLRDQSWTVAKALFSLGLRRGDCVGILAGNRYEYLVALLGAARIGCPVVVLNSMYTPIELHNALQRSECKVLFVAKQIGPKSLQDHLKYVQKQESVQPENKRLKLIVALDEIGGGQGAIEVQEYRSFLQSSEKVDVAEVRRVADLVTPEDVVNLQFTSGTTGAPKAAMLTSLNIINNGRFVGDRLQLTPEDIVCCPPPLFHCFGLVLGFLACFSHGSSILFASDSFNAARVMQAVFDERATVLLSVPTMFVAEMEVVRKLGRKPSHLRCALSAGSALSASLAEQLLAEMDLKVILISYGMTETSPVSFMTSMEDSLERRLRSLGRILPHTMAKVIDHNGHILPRGQRGELCITGFGLQKGYFKNQAKTDEVMKVDEKGFLWMHTGDEVLLDYDGYIHLTGRIKDIIIRGGENIFPGEIEDRLLEHAAIAEASIVGLQDEKYGEVVAAFLRLASTAEHQPSATEIRDWVTQQLGRHKAPSHVFWVGNGGAISDFPKTGSGKYQKHILRKMGDRILKGMPVEVVKAKI